VDLDLLGDRAVRVQLDHVIQRAANLPKNYQQVLEDLPRLRLEIPLPDEEAVPVHGDLPGDKGQLHDLVQYHHMRAAGNLHKMFGVEACCWQTVSLRCIALGYNDAYAVRVSTPGAPGEPRIHPFRARPKRTFIS